MCPAAPGLRSGTRSELLSGHKGSCCLGKEKQKNLDVNCKQAICRVQRCHIFCGLGHGDKSMCVVFKVTAFCHADLLLPL